MQGWKGVKGHNYINKIHVGLLKSRRFAQISSQILLLTELAANVETCIGFNISCSAGNILPVSTELMRLCNDDVIKPGLRKCPMLNRLV